MSTVTIRNVPDQVRDELAARAASSGRSLNEYVRRLLVDLAERPTPEDWVARARERVQTFGTSLGTTEILESLQADRR